MKAIIVANGCPADPAGDRRHLDPKALVIAADGGAGYCRSLGVRPDIIIGDMDSIDSDLIKPAPVGTGDTEIIRHPVRKDATDLELAIRLALERGARHLTLLGALGGRWDMSLGSLFLLALPELQNITIRIIDGRQEICLLSGSDTMVFDGKPGDTLSLIPASGPAAGVSLDGLEYPLSGATLPLGTSRGISNVFRRTRARVTLESGTLICVLIRKT